MIREIEEERCSLDSPAPVRLYDQISISCDNQPAIRSPGKTMFLKFMLAWLISANQVVVLCDSSEAHLFYHGQVYFRQAKAGFKGLPRQNGYYPVWTLIDVDYRDRGPDIPTDSRIWPFQTTSPNLDRWKAWSKQSGATLLGMPLWNVEELMAGYAFSFFSLLLSTSAMSFDRGSSLTVLRLYYSLRLHPRYNGFLSKLEQSLPLLDAPTLPTIGDNVIDAALEVLRERKKVVEAEMNGDPDDMDDGFTTSATDRDEDMADEAGQPPTLVITVDNALEILVDNAIEEFGFAPRDVYGGVFNPHGTRRKHAHVVENLDYTAMQKTVRFFSAKSGLDSITSRHVVVVFPRPHPTDSLLNDDRWAIDFKSIRIAKKATERMQLLQFEQLHEMFGLFHRIPASSTLAGWVFEAIVHRLFSGGWQSESVPQPIRMDLKGPENSPTFYTDSPSSADPSSSTPGTPSSPLRTHARDVTLVNLAPRQLSDVTLDDDRYYIPTATNNLLFDSFIIDVKGSASVISIFQMTTSEKHEGLHKGYRLIRKIVARVRRLLMKSYPDSAVTVTVAYFLVGPDVRSGYQWDMPIGWDENYRNNDHRGECFCLRIPVPGDIGTSCLFTPNLDRAESWLDIGSS